MNTNRFEKAEHQGRRDLRLLRLQRVVRRRSRAAEVQERPRPRSSSTSRARSTTASRPPRLVLFSPIALENHKSPNLPDGAEQQQAPRALHRTRWPRSPKANKRARSSICSPRRKRLYANAEDAADDQRHPPERGRQPGRSPRSSTRPCSRQAASTPRRRDGAREAPPGRPRQERSTGSTATATTDGYSIYGGRACLKFAGGQTNYEVAPARAGSPRRDDRQPRQGRLGRRAGARRRRPTTRNLPPFIPVVDEQAGPGAGRQAPVPRRRGGDREDDGRPRA